LMVFAVVLRVSSMSAILLTISSCTYLKIRTLDTGLIIEYNADSLHQAIQN